MKVSKSKIDNGGFLVNAAKKEHESNDKEASGLWLAFTPILFL